MLLSLYTIILGQVKVADLHYDSGLPKINLWKEEYLYFFGAEFWVLTVIHLYPYQLQLKLKNYKILEYECAKVFTLRVVASTLFMILIGIGDVYLKMNYNISDWPYLLIFLSACYYTSTEAYKFIKLLEIRNSLLPNKYLNSNISYPNERKKMNTRGKTLLDVFYFHLYLLF